MTPFYGEPFDILNVAIYFVERNYIDAAFSASSAVPVYSWVSTGEKWLRKISPQLTKPVSEAAGKLVQLSLRIKPTVQSLKNKIDDIFASNGFVKHEAKIGSNNGLMGCILKKMLLEMFRE